MAAEHYDLVIEAARAVVDQAERAVMLGVRDGRIVTLEATLPPGVAPDVVLGPDEVLLPGLVDTHVHVNEPGRTDWEGFASATRAAAAGGVTTIVDMPLNSVPPTTTLAGLRAKQEAARGRVHVDVGFWGGAVPGNLTDLGPLHDAGVLGFKCFLLPSGVEEFGHLDPTGLREALTELTRLGALLIVHAEDEHEIATVTDVTSPLHSRAYADFLATRPPRAELAAIEGLIAAAEDTGARVHIVHLSSGASLPLIRAARARGVRLSVETCPHYLTLAAEDIAEGHTEFKCCPPIREGANRDLLWEGLADGTIELIVSDHSPCPSELKCLDTGDFGRAWGGIASVQLGLAAAWTQARRRGHTLVDLAQWMSRGPADLVGLQGKGALRVGHDADLCVLAPDEEFSVEPGMLHHRHPDTAYAGQRLTGVVRGTWVRGIRVDAGVPVGRLLRRGEA